MRDGFPLGVAALEHSDDLVPRPSGHLHAGSSRRWNLLVTFLLATLALVARAGPLAFDPAEVDFGARGQDVRLAAEVRLTNTSATEIQILQVTSDCSCAAGEPRQRRLAPGASTILPVSLETRSSLGPVQRRLVVHTSAGDAEIRVKVNIRPYDHWEISPAPIMLESTLRSEEASAIVSVRYLGREARVLRGVSTGREWLRASLTKLPEGEPGFGVLLQKVPGAPAGHHAVDLALLTDDPSQPKLAAKVFVPVRSAARVVPSPVILPATRVGTASTAEVVLAGWDEAGPPQARLPRGQVSVLPRRANGDYVFKVTVAPAAAGMQTQVLQISAGDDLVLLEAPVMVKAEPR
jgi:hypothetical protein